MRYFKILSLIFCLVSSVLAQKQDFHFPKYAVQFQVSDLLKFSSYYGSVFSMKYHFNDAYAIRLGLSTRMEAANASNAYYQSDVANQDSLVQKQEDETNQKQIGLNVFLLKYLSINKPIKFYLGGGALISRSWNTGNAIKHDDNYDAETNNDQVNWTVGFRMLYGVEWFFHSHMSLQMDYGLGVFYNYYKKNQRKTNSYNQLNNKITTKLKYDRKSWKVNPMSIMLGLTVYL